MKVWLSGAAGFIGSTLTGKLLNAGHTVVGVDCLKYDNAQAIVPYLPHPRFEFHEHDACSRKALKLAQGCEVLIPLAALVGAPICDKQPEMAKAVNQEAIENLVRGASSAQRILYPMTESGYGSRPGDEYCREEDELEPLTHYGRTKAAGERAVLIHENSVVFRLATVFGVSPRMRFDLLVNDFTQQLYRERKLEIFEPGFMRSYIGVQDVTDAFLFGITHSSVRGVFNLGHPEASLTKLGLAHTICKELGLSTEKVTVGDGRDPDQRNYKVSNEKVLRTGFVFRHSLQQGIREVAKLCSLLGPKETRCMRNVFDEREECDYCGRRYFLDHEGFCSQWCQDKSNSGN